MNNPICRQRLALRQALSSLRLSRWNNSVNLSLWNREPSVAWVIWFGSHNASCGNIVSRANRTNILYGAMHGFGEMAPGQVPQTRQRISANKHPPEAASVGVAQPA